MENVLLLFTLMFPAACALALFGARLRKSKKVTAICCLIEFAAVTALFPFAKGGGAAFRIPYFMGTGLHLNIDMLRYVFIWITSFVWLLSSAYSIWYTRISGRESRFNIFFMLTLSAVIGVFMSGNLLNLFTFFELMAMFSYVLVIHDESKESYEAGRLYMAVSIVTGMMSLMGIFMLYGQTGELSISKLAHLAVEGGGINNISVLLMLSGFAAKACVFPLHIWLSSTYSNAPVPATAVFSAILAKAGVFGIIIIGFITGWDEFFSKTLLALSIVSMLSGGVLALMQIEIKNILAYSSMSQIGYILFSIAMAGISHSHPEAAVSAGIYHSVNHALIKTLLFMAAGVIIFESGCDDINSSGIGHKNTVLKLVFMTGMISNMGIPGFVGFTSKTAIHHAIENVAHSGEFGMKLILESVFLISSALTTAYSIKLCRAMFSNGGKKGSANEGVKSEFWAYAPMALAAAAMAFISIRPELINHIMGEGAAVLFEASSNAHGHFYTIDTIKSSGAVLALGIFTYKLFAANNMSVEDGGTVRYKDVSNRLPSIEKNFYVPVCIMSFKLARAVFGALDSLVGVSAGTAARACKEICSFNIKNAGNCNEDSNCSVGQAARKIAFRMESVNYSVFVTASILIVLMFVLVAG